MNAINRAPNALWTQTTHGILQACHVVRSDAGKLAAFLNFNRSLADKVRAVDRTGLFRNSPTSQCVHGSGDGSIAEGTRDRLLFAALCQDLNVELTAGIARDEFWEQALRRAAAAALIIEKLPTIPDSAITAALVLDVGILALFRQHSNRDLGALWGELCEAGPDQRQELEMAAFDESHDQSGALLLCDWGFPEYYVRAVAKHHSPPPWTGKHDGSLSSALYCAEWISAVFSVDDKASTLGQCRQVALEHLGFNAEITDGILEQIPARIEASAHILGLECKPQTSFDEILHDANLTIIEEILSFQDLTWQLQTALKEKDRLARELNHELNLAREIQRTLLPPAILEKFAVAGVNVPARKLSGDFYDHYTLKDGRIMFCLGDVSGKGTNAAILMAKTCGLFRGLGKHMHDPAVVLSIINEEIYETSTRGMFVTMVAGVYGPHDGEIQLVNAGHLPAILITADHRIRAFPAVASPLGVDAGADYRAESFALDEGSLYLFSDGLTEARVAKEQLGIEGLIELFIHSAQWEPTQRMKSLMSRFDSGGAPRDDLTLLLIEGASKSVKRPLPATTEYEDFGTEPLTPGYTKLFRA